MLQGLKFPDRHAKLLECLQMIERGLIERHHDANRFGAQRRDAAIHPALDDFDGFAGWSDHRIARHGHVLEADVGGADEHPGAASLLASLRECRDAIAAAKALPALPARSGRPTRSCAQQFFRGLPEAMWSPELNAKLLELAQTKVAMYDAYISEMEQMPEDERYLQQHSRSLGSRPIRVLSTGNHGVHSLDPSRPPDPEHQKYEEEVAREQAKWLELSSNARQLFTDKSSEYIPFDQPSFVVDAIREVYSQSK